MTGLVARALAVRHLPGLAEALAEQLCDAGLGDSDPAAATVGAVPGEAAVENLVRFVANPALRMVSLASGGTGVTYEVCVAFVLAVFPLACELLPGAFPTAGLSAGGQSAGPARPYGDAMMVRTVAAEALFVSDLQRGDRASTDEVRAAVRRMVCRHGTRDLAALVAQEYGEHPDTAVGRMSWALGAVRQAYPSAA